MDAAEQYLKKNDRPNYVREDAAFHTILAQANRNSRLRWALENMHHQMMVLRHRTFELSSQTSVVQHRRILNALEKGDPAGAEKLMVGHIRSVRQKLLSHLGGRDGSSGTPSPPKQRSDIR